MNFSKSEAILIAVLCITSVVDNIISVLTYIRG
jgi:hypothetical protein